MNINNNLNGSTALKEILPPDNTIPLSSGNVPKAEFVSDRQFRSTNNSRLIKEGNQGDPLSDKDKEALTEELNAYMDDLQTNLGFSVREELNHQVIVEIKNRQTDEIVKQIPAEELLTIKEKMEELTGLLFDQKV